MEKVTHKVMDVIDGNETSKEVFRGSEAQCISFIGDGLYYQLTPLSQEEITQN